MNLIADLEFRGLIYQAIDLEGLEKRLAGGPITLYNGFDPTGDSLHVGHLVPALMLRRFQLAGHRPIAVVGGGTGLVGDPSGRSSERQLHTLETVQEWTHGIRRQLEQYLDFDVKSNPAQVVNNYQWLSEMEMLSFLRDVGKHFSINAMLAKESVSARLETGISYTEFSYMILQAYDYLWLYENTGCELQTGGSDQWGNITAGADLIRRVKGAKVFGLTCPLITKTDGSKFGKSEGDAVWLDAAKTTPYQFYQFWINSSDEDVVPLLKYFTFLTHDEINQLEAEVKAKPWERTAQRTLAQEVTSLVHSREAAARAENISQALFYGSVRELSAEEIREGLNDVPSYAIRGETEVKLVDLLAEAGIAPSKRRAREDVKNGAISLNDERISDIDAVLSLDNRLHGQYLVLRRGKNAYFLVNWLH